MGFKPWLYLSLLTFASAALVGCNNTNPPAQQALKGPPSSPQTAQRPATFPGTPGVNQPAFPQVANNQPKASPFGPMPATGGTQTGFGQAPSMPTTNSPFGQNPGNPVSTPSQGFGPPPQVPAFQPLSGQSSGQIPLPNSRADTTVPANSALFPGQQPNATLPQQGGLPPVPPGFINARPN